MKNGIVYAIDPGSVESAYVRLDYDYKIYDFGKVQNEDLLNLLSTKNVDYELVIEMIASYGMPVGKDVFDTCVWIGRFWQASNAAEKSYIFRSEEKMNLCHSMKAKDANVRQALIDRFAKHDFKNGRGTKTDRDTFYGFKADIWAAMAVGVTYIDKQKEGMV